MRPPLEERGAPGALETLRILGRAFRYAAPFKGRFALKGVLLLASLLPLLLLPWPVKVIVDHVIEARPIGSQPLPYPAFLQPLMDALAGRSPTEILVVAVAFEVLLLALVGAVGTGGNERDQADAWLASGHDQATRTENEANAGFSMASGLLGLLDFHWTIRLTQALNHHYRSRLFERIQALPMTTFDDERIGDAIYRVVYDTPAITNAVYRIALTPVAAGVFALAIVWVLASVFGGSSTLVHSAWWMLGISFAASVPFAGAVRRRSSASRRAGATTTSTLEEGLSNILAVQSLGAGGREHRRFDRDSEASFARHRAVVGLAMGIFACALLPGLLVVSHALLSVSDAVIRGELSRGDFVLIFSYFVMLLFACIELGALWVRVQDSAVGLQRVFFLMDLPTERDPEGAHPLPRLRGGVRLEGVSYRHPDGTPALQGVDLEARVGEVIALVGPAGAGKTTLASLIPRFMEPSAGRILWDGRDASLATRDSVRSQVAFVFQETMLFDATVEENLRLGRAGAGEAELRRAARIAGADGFIRELPQGYRTALGRGGGKLSVGQKQRLAIARALLRDAPVLILDEPTSALDPETERRLVDALREAGRDKLVLMIAHRLSTIREADQIVFLQEGRVLERGSHEELMARTEGAYRRFVELQTRGAA